MSVGLCDVDVTFHIPSCLVDADLDGVDVANFVSQHFLDADVDAIRDFVDSVLDAHSNLDVDANLIVVDFLVVDHDVYRFLAFDAVEVVVFEPFDGYLLCINVVDALAMLVADSLLDVVEVDVVYLLLHCLLLMLMFFCCWQLVASSSSWMLGIL